MLPERRACLTSGLELAEAAARHAGELLQGLWCRPLDVIGNDAHDMKLEADYAANRAIVDILRTHSDWPVLTEEQGLVASAAQTSSSGWCWIVDPLDGTVNFARRIPLWCVSVALWQDGEPVLGVVHVPAQHESFTSVVGEGAWHNGVPICVSATRTRSDAVLCTGVPAATDFSHSALVSFAEQLRCFKKVRLLGSAALSMAYVAAGRADAYYERDIRVWDIAAGAALVRAAGGVVTMSPTSADIITVFAGNGFVSAS